jgi:hypothetical protein
MLGIDDPWVLAAYLLCIGSTLLCIVYGIICWNRGDEPVRPVDEAWAAQERKVEEEV